MDQITLKAYAKINLSLDVTGKLENGYHLVKMIMQTVNIFDVLHFEKTDGEIQIQLTAGNREVPLDQGNLIYKAVRLMQEKYGVKGGVKVFLEKNIPMAAGMAGGSADAAAALKAVNLLYDLGLTQQELQEVGVKIGADVPFCIMEGTALSEGIGEILTELPAPPRTILLVAKPPINVSTKEVYEELDSREIKAHPDVDGMVEAIRQGDLPGITKRLGNVLQTVTETKYPVISLIKKIMLDCGAQGSMMSGSGPTVFGIFEDREAAVEALEKICSQQLAETTIITGFGKQN